MAGIVLTEGQLTTTRRIRRVIWHWTGGAYKANDLDRRSYNFLIEYATGTPVLVAGRHPLEHQLPPLTDGGYAAHTHLCNSYCAGISVCAMGGAVQNDIRTYERYPVVDAQIEAMLDVTAQICKHHEIEVSPFNTLCHSEVQGTLNIPQRQKWDIDYVKGFSGNAKELHDSFRERLAAKIGDSQPIEDIPKATVVLDWSGKLHTCLGLIEEGSVYIPAAELTHLGAKVRPSKLRRGAQVVSVGFQNHVFDPRYYGDDSATPWLCLRELAAQFLWSLEWKGSTKTVRVSRTGI